MLLFLNVSGSEFILIFFVFLLMFGGKSLPTFAKALGRGIREFKDATQGIQKDITEGTSAITREVNEHIQEAHARIEKTKEESDIQ